MTFHEEILSQLLLYKESRPDFRFIPRQRNTKGKMDEGYWFQGNEGYAFIGLVDRSGGVNMTRSVGLVFWPAENHLEFSIEIVHKGEDDKDILSLYEKLKTEIVGLTEKNPEKFYKYIGDTSNGFNKVFNFLDEYYPKIVSVFANSSFPELIIDENKFQNLLSKINSYRKNIANHVNKLLINITWNSKDWKEESEDDSNHRWVKEGGTPGESLNFAKDADGNTEDHIFGYAKFTHEPKIVGSSIFVFYSNGKIVGFYGNAELTNKELEEGIILNLKGDQSLSFVLENKIDNAKELGFLEDKERVGMINFNYIENNKTVVSILNKALELNPNQEEEILRLKKWFIEKTKFNENIINYWIFQGNPKIYDAVTALQNHSVKTWTVTSHKDKIKKGDKFILWLTGVNPGCYAIGTVASKVTLMKEEDIEMGYYLSPTTQIDNTRVRIEIDYYLEKSPVLWEVVKDEEVFSDFKGSNQGTNFTATKAQYDVFLEYAQSKTNDYEDVKNVLDTERVAEYLSIVRDFVFSQKLKSDDDRISFNVRKNKNRLVFIIGNKYAFAIEKRNAKTEFWLLSKELISENYTTFINQKGEVEAYWNNIDDLEKVKPNIANELNTELNKNAKCPYRKFTNNDFINDVYQNIENMEKNTIVSQSPLNQILFGPPGTGKTFNTINEALKIVDPIYFAAHQNDRKKLTDRFKELLIKSDDDKNGQIGFCTFHQSMSYEDFVEGIKPKTTESKSVYYDVEPGIFKRICQLGDSYNSTLKVKKEGKFSWTEDEFRKASFYKLSLGNYQDPSDRPIYEYCRDHGYIAIGFGQENDFTGLTESEIKEKCEELKLEITAAQQMNFFIHYLKKGNYVIVSSGNKYVRAIGKVSGDYEYWEDSPIRYNHFRKVEWLFTDELIPIEEIYERGLSQKTMYKIDENALKRDFFTNNGQETFMPERKEKNYVLIIDEINRGNVSSIFGELITLIEKDKRAGCDEELEVTLPYSKEPFKVPNNVYLIGTMNTADRSIEALDTALRRRFSFKEFAPRPHLIKAEGASSKVKGIVENINLEYLLNTINNRIEKLIDKDHQIGHSYFLKVDNKEKLIHAFKNEIIPLLEEYFFGDYGKIGLVLGSNFVEKINHDFDFAKFEHYDTDIQSDLKEKAVFRIKNEKEWDFSTI
jgi:5-methylcytosine-specific restriction protein B